MCAGVCGTILKQKFKGICLDILQMKFVFAPNCSSVLRLT